MSIIRSYFSKNTTLIKGNYSNNSRNPVFELSYGGSLSSSSTYISRYVFKIDLDNVIEKINDDKLFQSNITSHKIKIKNVISESKDLIGGLFIDAYRGSNATVLAFPLNENFVEGTGFDFIYNATAYNENFLNQTPANWYYRDSGVSWSENGIYSSLTPNIVLTTQYLQDGSEDLELDITNYINGILFSGNTNYGIGLAFSSNTESFTSENRYVITFFSKYTQTFYEPFLETEYDQTITDNRCDFKLDDNNKLYLISNKDLTSVNKVEIYDDDDTLVNTFLPSSITLVSKNVWGINLTISSDDYPDLINFTDKWYYTINSKSYTIDQEFTLFSPKHFNNNKDEISEYHFSFFGIKYNEKITRDSGVRKIMLKGKRLYGNSIEYDLAVDSIQYRIYNQQSNSIELQIIPWTDVNITSNGTYFELDPSWLIPQFYYIELRVIVNGYEIKTNNRIKFNILSEL